MKNYIHKITIISFAALLGLSGCSHQGDFDMRNPDTGDEITCEDRGHWFEEDVPDSMIATECVQACARFGYKLVTNEGVALDTPAHAPSEDAKDFIPSACLADSEK